MSLGAEPVPIPSLIPGSAVHVWCSADQAELVSAVKAGVGATGFKVCGVDGTQTAALVSALEVEGLDDPRELGRLEVAESRDDALDATSRGPAVWLAADADLPAVALRAVRGCRAVIVSALPHATDELPWDVLELPCSLRAAFERLELDNRLREFGAIHALHLEVRADPALGGLGMAIFDAIDAACALMEPAECVAASIVAPDGRPLRATGLRLLAGSASAHLRDRLGRGTTFLATDRSPTSRRASIAGEQGLLLLEDGTLRWFDRRGREIDCCVDPVTTDHPGARGAAELVRALRRAAGVESPPRVARPPHFRTLDEVKLRLAICDAVRLGAITGAAESTSSMLAAINAPGT